MCFGCMRLLRDDTWLMFCFFRCMHQKKTAMLAAALICSQNGKNLSMIDTTTVIPFPKYQLLNHKSRCLKISKGAFKRARLLLNGSFPKQGDPI